MISSTYPPGQAEPFMPGSLFTTAEPPVFAERKPREPSTIKAVQLRTDNLIKVVVEMLKYGRALAVHVPSGRASITWGEIRFDVGQWIVADIALSPDTYHYRRPTMDEVELYGLS